MWKLLDFNHENYNLGENEYKHLHYQYSMKSVTV